MKTPLQLLEELQLAYRSGTLKWTKGAYWRDREGISTTYRPDVEQTCIDGGLRYLCGAGGDGFPTYNEQTTEMQPVFEAASMIIYAANKRMLDVHGLTREEGDYEDYRTWNIIADFNDDPLTDFEDVLEVLGAAIEANKGEASDGE